MLNFNKKNNLILKKKIQKKVDPQNFNIKLDY